MNAGANNPAVPVTTKRRVWLRRSLKALLYSLLLVCLGTGLGIGLLVLKYRRIVGAQPGGLVTRVEPLQLGRQVNPFIGTGGIPWVCGNNFPGAMVPFGVIRLGPETASMLTRTRALNTSGYYYGDDQLLGFSHTRLNGTGATDGGHFLVLPAREPVSAKLLRRPATTRFSHRHETASPGYYAVRLPELGVMAELTATPRVGVHRYTYEAGKPVLLRLDVANALGGRRSDDAWVRVLPEEQRVEGHVRTFGTFGGRYGGLKVYFAARFDLPFERIATWQNGEIAAGQPKAAGERVGVEITFDTRAESAVVTAKLAISHVSIENARANLEAEAAGKTFEQVVAAAQSAWEDRLSSIRILGGTPQQRRVFYTALCRAFQMPTRFNDVNGEYLGFDRKVHRAAGFDYYTDLSLWDTFRTVHPLYTLIAPGDQRDMIMSLLMMAEQGGWLPRWPAGAGYSNSMLGTPADIVITEAYLKGIRGFDVEAAYQAMRRTALAPVPAGSPFSGREGIEHYLEYGYCPSGLMPESVSRTFEFGWADSAIARLAEALGRTDDAALFREHSRFYTNLWNPATQYFQPRQADGTFFEPFKPLLLTYFDAKGKYTRDYVEGSALQWRWGSAYDASQLISLFQSREYFVQELDRFFSQSSPARGRWNPGPYYWHGNQPDIHTPYLFNEAGRPDLTQKWVRWILEKKYGDGYEGLDGNDDGGTLSAWYVFSSLGLYPVAATDVYQLTGPLFERAEIRLPARPLVIAAEHAGPGRPYVEAAWLNGLPLERTWIRHEEIAGGGTLRFRMSATPGRWPNPPGPE